jgi:hypothetical protein
MAENVRNCLKNGVLTARQENAAITLARGGTYPEAAESAGVAERTIKSWLKLPNTSLSPVEAVLPEMLVSRSRHTTPPAAK